MATCEDPTTRRRLTSHLSTSRTHEGVRPTSSRDLVACGQVMFNHRVNVEDVGPLPTLPSPQQGQHLTVTLAGLPPAKTFGRSMRHPSSPQWPRFRALRRAAIEAMAGRMWYDGAIGMTLVYFGPDPAPVLRSWYAEGIMDTLDASRGSSWVYLPICYLDDVQVTTMRTIVRIAPTDGYKLTVEFL